MKVNAFVGTVHIGLSTPGGRTPGPPPTPCKGHGARQAGRGGPFHGAGALGRAGVRAPAGTDAQGLGAKERTPVPGTACAHRLPAHLSPSGRRARPRSSSRPRSQRTRPGAERPPWPSLREVTDAGSWLRRTRPPSPPRPALSFRPFPVGPRPGTPPSHPSTATTPARCWGVHWTLTGQLNLRKQMRALPGAGGGPAFPSVKRAPPRRVTDALPRCRKPHRWRGPLSVMGAQTPCGPSALPTELGPEALAAPQGLAL